LLKICMEGLLFQLGRYMHRIRVLIWTVEENLGYFGLKCRSEREKKSGSARHVSN